ncbi:Lipase [Balamuthia mandrillaris]
MRTTTLLLCLFLSFVATLPAVLGAQRIGNKESVMIRIDHGGGSSPNNGAPPAAAPSSPPSASASSPSSLLWNGGDARQEEELRRLLLQQQQMEKWWEEDPDQQRTFTQIVEAKGYPVEEHFVTTEDGYILRVFRIPYGKSGSGAGKRGPVFLQHGLLDSAFTWILNYPNESLSYILADNGYDVWMGNSRGNTYSTNHTTLKPSDAKFWDFSWDEMARYDLPAQLGYVLNVTGYKKLPYIGHSQGTIQMFAALVSGYISSDILSYYIALGPVATVGNVDSFALKLLADLGVADIIALFGIHEFLPAFTGPASWVFSAFCNLCPVCCEDVIELLCGAHQGAFNASRMAVVAAHEPGGTSVINIIHWAQGIHSGKFQMYDYGRAGNLKHYSSPVPPQYDLSLMPTNLPIALYSGGKDLLADPTDVKNLIAKLPAHTYWKIIPDYAHLDFAWALDANKLIYQEVLGFLSKVTAAKKL